MVDVTRLRTIDRSRLEERLGALPTTRTREVLAGIALVLGLDPLEVRDARE